MEIVVYTDGSALNNQHKGKRRGGCGVFFSDNDTRNRSIPLKETDTEKVTNQVAELNACLIAIELVFNTDDITAKKNKLIIYTDSMYSINCISKWCKTWKKNNWCKSDKKVIENLELIQKIYK